jgi:selenocysteine-specific elongation factor
MVMATETAAGLLKQVVLAVGLFHRENRLRPGLPKAELSSSLGVDPDSIALLVAGSDQLVDEGAVVRSVDFEPGLTPTEESAWEAAQAHLGAGLAVPRSSQLGLSTELLHALVRDDRLTKIGEDLVYLPHQIAAIKEQMEQLNDEFTVAEFRDQIGVTRRQAIPLLEWFDKTGITARRGDTRVLR